MRNENKYFGKKKPSEASYREFNDVQVLLLLFFPGASTPEVINAFIIITPIHKKKKIDKKYQFKLEHYGYIHFLDQHSPN